MGGGVSGSGNTPKVTTGRLLATKFQPANRTQGSNRYNRSYTKLSNTYNGQKTTIIINNDSDDSDSTELTTAQKWQLGLTIGGQVLGALSSLIPSNSDKAAGPERTDGPGRTNTPKRAGGPSGSRSAGQTPGAGSSTPKSGNADLSATLASYGIEDVDFNNVDYKSGAKNFVSQMNNAKTSADLYQALQGAKAYKAQVDARVKGFNPDSIKAQLATYENDGENSISKAKDAYSDAQKSNSDAKSDLTRSQQQVTSARTSYDTARAAIKTDDEAYNKANAGVDDASKWYDSSIKTLSSKKQALNNAKSIHRQATQSYEMAKANTQEAKANLDALKAQATASTNSAALQAQIQTAQTAYETACREEETARQAEQDAIQQENSAQSGVSAAESGVEEMKGNLTQARTTLSNAAKNLAGTKKEFASSAQLLSDRQESVKLAEDNIEKTQTKFYDTQETMYKAEDNLDALKENKAKFETQLHDYNELLDAQKQLDDSTLSKWQTKLDDMMKKEGVTHDKLEKQLNEQNNISNSSDQAAKARAKAEGKEATATSKLANLNANSADHLMNADARMRAATNPNSTATGDKGDGSTTSRYNLYEDERYINDYSPTATATSGTAPTTTPTTGSTGLRGKSLADCKAMGESFINEFNKLSDSDKEALVDRLAIANDMPKEEVAEELRLPKPGQPPQM